MIGSIGLFICGCGLAFSVSLAYDTYLENKMLKEKIKEYLDKERSVKLIKEVEEYNSNGD